MLLPGGGVTCHLLLLAWQELKDQCPSLPERDAIRWVITVPAIWKQPAKQFMREAAYKVRGRPRGEAVPRSDPHRMVSGGGAPPSPPLPVAAACITMGLWLVLVAQGIGAGLWLMGMGWL